MRATPGVETDTTRAGGIGTRAALPSWAGTPAAADAAEAVTDVEVDVDEEEGAPAKVDVADVGVLAAEGDDASPVAAADAPNSDRGGTDVSRRHPAGTQADLRGAAEYGSGLDEVDDESWAEGEEDEVEVEEEGAGA